MSKQNTGRPTNWGTLPPGGGSSMPKSNPIKKIQKGAGPRQPETVGGKMNSAPGSNLPKNSPRKPPKLGEG